MTEAVLQRLMFEPRPVLGGVILAVGVLAAALGCDGKPGPRSLEVDADGTAAAASSAHAPTVHLITAKDHRHVIKMDIGDSVELPQDSDYNYEHELKDPSIFRADSATHFTAVKSGPTPLVVHALPICREPDAHACGRSQERWIVELIVR
jgi:hypothetical protein